MVEIDRINIIPLDGLPDPQGINERLKTLLLCTETTIPGSRAFGLSRNFIDENPNEAAAVLAQELQEKCDVYIPEIDIDSVEYEYDLSGRLSVNIYIEGDEIYDSRA